MKTGLETIYNHHHTTRRGHNFVILKNERGGWLKEKVGTDKKVLDIGCRDGALTSTYVEGNFVTGADIDSASLVRAKENLGIETIHTDLNGEWPFEKETFDAVVACEVIEHMYYPEIVFEKINSILKPGGLFVGTIPHAFSLQCRIKLLFGIKSGTPLQDPTHINQFSYKEYKGLLEKHFTDVETRGITAPRFKIFESVLPFLFAHDIMWSAKKK
jgi:2-polyprenyl-3-methyl-5-hydroxy-6-metoxy-1,4-benzoquinol methylase